MAKLWGGRFEKETDGFAEEFNASIGVDSRMAAEDIRGSIAHARMLGRQGVIGQDDAQAIIKGLEDILADLRAGTLEFLPGDEDIHMAVERILTERIGEAGKRLHTGRSRNDQVATDFRLYLMGEMGRAKTALAALCGTLVDIAEDNMGTVTSAYTHLQKAQPTTLAHYMMAYFEMFYRDLTRLGDCEARANVLPLGSGALCGTTYPIDREAVAAELGFAEISRNSLDAVSDRDFALEFLSAASICMMHLSRLAEELVLFSTNEFGILKMDDAYSTGSSIMPQKKNPDMAELVRGKTGRVYGDLVGLLTVMKGLPLAYNKDMQEDKEGAMDAADTLCDCVRVMDGMLKTAVWNKEKMREGAGRGFTDATDAADYFVKKGMAFRDAHEAVGRMVLYCEKKGVAIGELSLEEVRRFAPSAGEDMFDAVSLDECVRARGVPGGPAPEAVEAHIRAAKRLLGEV